MSNLIDAWARFTGYDENMYDLMLMYVDYQVDQLAEQMGCAPSYMAEGAFAAQYWVCQAIESNMDLSVLARKLGYVPLSYADYFRP